MYENTYFFLPFRFFFPDYQREGLLVYWLVCDYSCDALCLLDILVFKYRLMFMDKGFWVRDKQVLIRDTFLANYSNSRN